ncbi:MAG: hypothetical protein K0Q91_520 [Fibrobacteria bacterium]|jgi:hypothetical protein|nr:hypothetical protein [Fibrobacteria bacterium]
MRLFLTLLSTTLTAIGMTLQGCTGGDDSTTRYCGVSEAVETEKVLTPANPSLELSTAPGDSAFTDGVCGVQFQLSFGFADDSLQALAFSDGPFAIPLAGLVGNSPNLFFMNDSVRQFSKWSDFRPPVHAFDTTLHFLSTWTHPEGPARRGTYTIRASLSPTITNPDSSVYVRARIRYYKGTPYNGYNETYY